MTDSTTPSQRRFDKNRQAILDAARIIVTEQGIAALSMRTLAARVDYSPSALYKYFTDKEEIMDELTAEAWALSLDFSQRHMSTSAEPVVALMQTGMNIYEFAKQYPVQYQLTMAKSKSSPNSLEALMEDPGFKGLRMFLAGNVEAGQLRLPDGFTPDLMAFQLWFLIHGVSMLRLNVMSKFGAETDELMNQINAALSKMLSPK
jgi:AcrR family transcriptional regulator